MSNVSIKTRNNDQHVMSLETYARWLCLLEGMDVIERTAQQYNIDLDKRHDLLKPLALQKYINERYHGMLHDVRVEESIDVDTFDVAAHLNINQAMV